jgi:RHS repeat-associated protein
LQTIVQGSETFTYGYDTLSRRTSLARPNGITTNYQYDEVARLKRLTHVNASSVTLEDLQYEFNLDDEINKITSLASAPLTPTSKAVTTADAANRIGQFGAASFGFDAAGQTTSRTDGAGTTAYQWDARGRLTQATLPNGQAVGYGYDALGRRVSRAASGLTTTFQYDGADVVIDREGGGGDYDYLNGVGIDDKLRQAGGAFGALYFLQDHLGSTTALTGTGGGLVEPQQQYEAFGGSAGSVRTRYGYTGRERDGSTELIYYRARWFDSSQGRFQSEDPIGFRAGLNLYAYTRNNPLKWKDPTGNDVWAVAEVGAGAHWIYGINGAFGVTVNLKTGERCIFVKACGRLGPIFSFGIGGKLGAQFFADHCGKDVGGPSIEAALEIESPAGGFQGNVAYGGGVEVGVGAGPGFGVALAAALDLCGTKIIKCFGTPCECK